MLSDTSAVAVMACHGFRYPGVTVSIAARLSPGRGRTWLQQPACKTIRSGFCHGGNMRLLIHPCGEVRLKLRQVSYAVIRQSKMLMEATTQWTKPICSVLATRTDAGIRVGQSSEGEHQGERRDTKISGQ